MVVALPPPRRGGNEREARLPGVSLRSTLGYDPRPLRGQRRARWGQGRPSRANGVPWVVGETRVPHSTNQ
jgi:hypothetical protein